MHPTRVVGAATILMGVVSVNSFRRDRKYPCPADQADGHTNAFTRVSTHFLLIFSPNLQRHQRRYIGW